MYITNPKSIKDKYCCNEKIANYLIYKKKFPLLSSDSLGNFYFAGTKELYDAIKNLPFWLLIFK